jgi:putative two-component system response regulator
MPKPKVALVDDSTANLLVGKRILSEKFDVETLMSAEAMFVYLETTLPDLILLDVLMPEMSGYEAIVLLKGSQRTRDIPVIFLTSLTDSENEIEGLDLGAVDYILKPFSPALLIKRIESHLLLEDQKKELKGYASHLEDMVAEKTRTISTLQESILVTMSRLAEFRDATTGEHIDRTSHLFQILVEILLQGGVYDDILGGWDLALLAHSAQLHDVGKIAIRDMILLKPTKLDFGEFEEMKKHTLYGESIIDSIQSLAKGSHVFLTHAKILASSHHEKWDGSGYPRGLSGENIPLQGRIMAIVDVYDALVSERPYKKAFTHDAALDILRDGRGTHFDPLLIDAFVPHAQLFKAS